MCQDRSEFGITVYWAEENVGSGLCSAGESDITAAWS